jgi:hypothetical protein
LKEVDQISWSKKKTWMKKEEFSKAKYDGSWMKYI